jgi:hypothetical protein
LHGKYNETVSPVIQRKKKKNLYIKCWSPKGMLSFREKSRSEDLNSIRRRKNERMYGHLEFTSVGSTTRSLTLI